MVGGKTHLVPDGQGARVAEAYEAEAVVVRAPRPNDDVDVRGLRAPVDNAPVGVEIRRVAIGPAPVIASNNTLGSQSPYQGRLYAAYVNYARRDAQLKATIASNRALRDFLIKVMSEGWTSSDEQLAINFLRAL